MMFNEIDVINGVIITISVLPYFLVYQSIDQQVGGNLT